MVRQSAAPYFVNLTTHLVGASWVAFSSIDWQRRRLRGIAIAFLIACVLQEVVHRHISQIWYTSAIVLRANHQHADLFVHFNEPSWSGWKGQAGESVFWSPLNADRINQCSNWEAIYCCFRGAWRFCHLKLVHFLRNFKCNFGDFRSLFFEFRAGEKNGDKISSQAANGPVWMPQVYLKPCVSFSSGWFTFPHFQPHAPS